MAQNPSNACQTALYNFLLDNVEEAAVLPEQDFVHLAPALDLSTAEWIGVFQAYTEAPSSRREIFRETVDHQIVWLSLDIHDNDLSVENLELAKRIDALPRILKVIVLETIERFWTRDLEGSSLEERLHHWGLRPCESAHARSAALAYRRHVLSG